MSTSELSALKSQYNSVLSHWDKKSAVRAKPKRCLTENDSQLPFSAELTPAASHSLIRSRGPGCVREFLAHRLYSYLDFTTVLEQEIVNPVVLRMSRDAFGLQLPGEMQFDAYRIYCDEAYHALMSADMRRQVEGATGVLAATATEPAFVRAIRQAKCGVPGRLAPLVEFCATTVSETLISGTLTRIPEDEQVLAFVRESIADHAADERTHHAYFTRAFEIAWPQLDREAQRLLAPYFADFIVGFLAPDLHGQQGTLQLMGFAHDDAVQIVWGTNPAPKARADIQHAARSTLRLLDRMGVMRQSGTEEHFYQLGVISGENSIR
jgi:hypothetical protein